MFNLVWGILANIVKEGEKVLTMEEKIDKFTTLKLRITGDKTNCLTGDKL